MNATVVAFQDAPTVATDTTPIVPVILCGGMGSRLWPMSRSKYPKQFLGLNKTQVSLLQETAARVKPGANIQRPVVVSNIEHKFLVADHMERAGFSDLDIILEPQGRNTAPAITAAALFIQSKYKNALMLVLPSDHIIRDDMSFQKGIENASKAALEGNLVTFGISPEYPETGYGYIQRGKSLNGGSVFAISQFVEKPDHETANKYLEAGDYSWNSGMFMFPTETYLSEIKEHQPEIFSACENALKLSSQSDNFLQLDRESFGTAPEISVDYAVMEKTKKAAVVPLSCGWSDAGAWDSLWRIGDKDKDGNVVCGISYQKDTKNCYLRTEDGPPVAALGIEDVVVVSTKDAVLISRKDRAQDVKKLIEQVKIQNDELIDHHSRIFRPWGSSIFR
jgi:mannose-1-phosphate guanylyltransferase/mannose-6-phosphate isomerase